MINTIHPLKYTGIAFLTPPLTPKVAEAAMHPLPSSNAHSLLFRHRNPWEPSKAHMEQLFSVSTRNVDPAKLASRLNSKFGRGGFRIEMRHSTYRVYAKYGLHE
ncbi:hypothetical protein GGR51DRAFT_270794 [Nemania sp. FL0031]|nr:hypothetical protein GGR51DRAFT_270794 [Nemania sp. FL0031]